VPGHPAPIQIAGRATTTTCLAFPGQADLLFVIDSRRNLDRQPFATMYPALAPALFAGSSNDLAFTLATAAGRDVHKLAEERLLDLAYLTTPVALWAAHQLGVGFGTLALAAFTGLPARNIEHLLAANAASSKLIARS